MNPDLRLRVVDSLRCLVQVGDLVMVDSDCGIKGVAVFVESQLYGFCKILFNGSVMLMDKCYLERINASR